MPRVRRELLIGMRLWNGVPYEASLSRSTTHLEQTVYCKHDHTHAQNWGGSGLIKQTAHARMGGVI